MVFGRFSPPIYRSVTFISFAAETIQFYKTERSDTQYFLSVFVYGIQILSLLNYRVVYIVCGQPMNVGLQNFLFYYLLFINLYIFTLKLGFTASTFLFYVNLMIIILGILLRILCLIFVKQLKHMPTHLSIILCVLHLH